MPAVVRMGDNSTGDPCGAGPRANSQGCSITFTNGKPTHCMSHSWMPHACPKSPPHGANTITGSGKTFAEGLPVARKGDLISCMSTCNQGSPNVESG